MRPVVTIVDRFRILHRVGAVATQATRSTGARILHNRLESAVLVESDSVPPDCVTMNSRVRLRYHATGQERTLRLAYPRGSASSEPDAESVSVLSPVGAALLGARKGETVRWEAPSGALEGTVVDILYQPEASGDPD